MSYYLKFYIFISILSVTVLIGLVRFRSMDKGGRIFCLLLCCSLVTECASFILAILKGTNTIVYHIYSPVEFFLVSLYFNTTINTFRKKNIGIYIGVIGVIVSILNTVFFQTLQNFNTYYLLFEGLCFISMSLFSFYQIMLKDNYISPLKDPHFRISFLLLFFWCVTFIAWGVYEMMNTPDRSQVIGLILWIANIILYSGSGIVFLLYRKQPKPVPSEYA